MLLGHFGVALAAKKAAPKTSLAVLVGAGEGLDLLRPVLLLAGGEHVRVVKGITAVTPFDFYDHPISHSLVTALIWGALAAALYFVFRRYSRGAWVIGALVPSHWLLDWVVHRPDRPLWPGSSPKFDLGIWNSWPLTLGVEFLIFGAGLFIYARSTRPKNQLGRYLLWAWAAILGSIVARYNHRRTSQRIRHRVAFSFAVASGGGGRVVRRKPDPPPQLKRRYSTWRRVHPSVSPLYGR